MGAVTIKDVKTIMTQPARSRLVVVKVITSEPGLYGLGCATFTQRCHAVYAAVENHLKPFLVGRDVSHIEEIFGRVGNSVQGAKILTRLDGHFCGLGLAEGLFRTNDAVRIEFAVERIDA